MKKVTITMARNESNSAHNKAVEALASARQHVRKYRFDLERSTVPDKQIYVPAESENHPQKNAHAALMDYYEELNQTEYTMMVDDIWPENFSDAKGNEITVEVPIHDTVQKTVTEESGIDSFIPNMDKIETREIPTSLETLGHKWAGRTITAEAKIESPYRQADSVQQNVRVWLPPILIKAAYSRMNDCLSKIGLLAQTHAPVEHDPTPI